MVMYLGCLSIYTLTTLSGSVENILPTPLILLLYCRGAVRAHISLQYFVYVCVCVYVCMCVCVCVCVCMCTLCMRVFISTQV